MVAQALSWEWETPPQAEPRSEKKPLYSLQGVGSLMGHMSNIRLTTKPDVGQT